MPFFEHDGICFQYRESGSDVPLVFAATSHRLRQAAQPSSLGAMVIIRFPDTDAKRRGLGFLVGRFSGKSWATGEVMVPEIALAHLAAEGIPFSVEGPATYDKIAPLRNPPAAAVQ